MKRETEAKRQLTLVCLVIASGAAMLVSSAPRGAFPEGPVTAAILAQGFTYLSGLTLGIAMCLPFVHWQR
jgi:hypothetical protein